MRNTTRIQGVLWACLLWLGADCVQAQNWPQWHGPNRDNKVTGFKAPATWPKELTKKWQVTVGIGESSPVLADGKIYTFGRQGKEEVTLCLDAATGKEIWKDGYEAEAVGGPAKGFPGTRSTPAVGEGKVCTLGVGGVLSCLDAATGKKVWRDDSKAKPQFYTSSSPLIADGKCIVFRDALTAYDLATGDVKWKWTGAGTPYGSPVVATIDGVKQVVTPSSTLLAGISLDEGKLLWSVKISSGGFDYVSNYSTPIIDGSTVLFSIASKSKGGSMLALKIEKKSDGFTATELWKNSKPAAGYHAPVLDDGRIYGVNLSSRAFYCLDAKTGEEIWKDDVQRGQCGSILNLGPILVALTSDKDLVIFQAGGEKFKEVAKYRVSDSETWCVPILAGDRIYVKDKAGMLTLWTLGE